MTGMSIFIRDRRALLIPATIAVVAIVSALMVTLGVLAGAQAVSTVAGGPSGVATPTADPSRRSTLAAASTVPTASAPAPTPTVGSPTSKPSASAPASAAASAPRSGTSRRVTFVNRTKHTIWVAGYQQTPKPALKKTGWKLKAGHKITIKVADKWNGRFWGRTGCTFDAKGKGHCVTGDCGRFQCTGYGAIPASLAEFNFNAWQHLDFYDVSLVDGSNLPMWINHTGGTKDAISKRGCSAAGCTAAVKCPKALRVDGGGCSSPCAKIGGDQYCCAGKWAPRSECDPSKWPVNYAAVFKRAEPFAYSYVDDDATSTFTCKGRCDYRITFGLTPKKKKS